MVKQSKLGNTSPGAFLFSNTKSCRWWFKRIRCYNGFRNASNAGLGRGYTELSLQNCGQVVEQWL